MHNHDTHPVNPRGERRFRPEWPPSGDGFPPFPGGPGGPGGPMGRGRRGRRGGPGGGPGPEHRGGRRGPRARGDVRAAILLLLAEQPRHGYELIQEIAERSSGFWTPSPGSVYPTLQALEDEGLIRIEPVEGRRTASLTELGVTYVEEHRDRLGTPWTSSGTGHGPALALRQEIIALRDAATQVARVGTPAQHTAAAAVLVTARKELYRLLAEDTPATES